jgi:hypothetical protein
MNTNSKMMQLVGAVERPTIDEENNKTTKTWWTRIGLGFENRDESWTLKLDYVPTRLHETTIQLRPMRAKGVKEEEDAAEISPSPMNTKSKMMQLVGAVERSTLDNDNNKTTKTWWTRIGIAFQNSDESWTLKFDYLPTRLHETTIQLRPMRAKGVTEEEEAAE